MDEDQVVNTELREEPQEEELVGEQPEEVEVISSEEDLKEQK